MGEYGLIGSPRDYSVMYEEAPHMLRMLGWEDIIPMAPDGACVVTVRGGLSGSRSYVLRRVRTLPEDPGLLGMFRAVFGLSKKRD